MTNVSKRLCDQAKAGEILVSGRVADSLGNTGRTEPLGEMTLKGIARPVAVYSVMA